MIEFQEPKLAEDQQPYTLQNIPVTIATIDHSVSIDQAILQISDQGFTILQELPQEQWLTVFTTFANTTSVGNDHTNLMIFVGDNEIEEEEQMPQVLQIISSKTAANLNLNGNSFTLTLDLSSFGMNVLKEINDIMVNYMGQANERASHYDEDEECAQMISADDIDQNGNIISGKKIEAQSQSDDQSMQEGN